MTKTSAVNIAIITLNTTTIATAEQLEQGLLLSQNAIK